MMIRTAAGSSEEVTTMQTERSRKVEEVATRFQNMRLPVMAAQLRQMEIDGKLATLNSLEVLDQLTAEQRVTTSANSIRTRKSKAKLYWPNADLADVDYRRDRHINAALIDTLSTNDYIRNDRNVIITAASGCGKTFFCSALGNRACEDHLRVTYYTMSDFLYESDQAERQGRLKPFLEEVGNTNLFIMDDFLLTPMKESDVAHIFELLNTKTKRGTMHRSFMIGTIYPKKDMYERLAKVSEGIGDAIINRLTGAAFELLIQGRSMREADPGSEEAPAEAKTTTKAASTKGKAADTQ